MKNLSSRFNLKPLWQAALALPVSIGFLSLPSQAATVETATAEFGPAVVDLTCAFTGGDGGQLDHSADKLIIATNVGSGAPAAFTVTTNFAGTLLASQPTLVKSTGTLQTLVSSNPLLNGVEQGSIVFSSGANAIDVGASFVAQNEFEAGSYDTSVTLTCTDNGVAD